MSHLGFATDAPRQSERDLRRAAADSLTQARTGVIAAASKLRATIVENLHLLDHDEARAVARAVLVCVTNDLEDVAATPADRLRIAGHRLADVIAQHHRHLDRDTIDHALAQLERVIALHYPASSADSTDCADRDAADVPPRATARTASAQSAKSVDALPLVITGPGGDYTKSYTPTVARPSVPTLDVVG